MRRFLLAVLCCVAVSAAEWTQKDEDWLQGKVAATNSFDVKNANADGISGVWNAYYVDYDNQDKMLAALGVDLVTRNAIWYASAKPTFRIKQHDMTPKQIDADNGNVKAHIENDAEKVPVVELRTEILTKKRLLQARVDGKEHGAFDESVNVEWTVRSNLLADGRMMLVRTHADKGTVRELRVALSKDPKGEQSGPVLLYEAHLEQGSQAFSNTMWLQKAASLEAAKEFLQ